MINERCPWCIGNELYEKYHDEEWGVPVYDDKILFEFLLLEAQQAGLNWLTILKKRENYRQAFANFNPEEIANFDESKVEELMQNLGIVRNKAKILATINNAKCFLEVQKEIGSFHTYIWSFNNNTVNHNSWKSVKEVPSTSLLAEEISIDLRKKEFKFLGPTTIYAYLQAIGVINDHLITCFRWNSLKEST